jgi:phosphinothricin acetyltransferase
VRDLPAVAAIYAPYVRDSVITFETEPPDPVAWEKRFDAVVSRGLPFLVAESAGEVVGYAYAGPWKERAAYRHTVENAIYLAPEKRGRGVGAVLLEALLKKCAEAGVRQVVAVIADTGHPASMRLHARSGFRHVGRLEQVGFKHGRWIDTVLMQRSLLPVDGNPAVTRGRSTPPGVSAASARGSAYGPPARPRPGREQEPASSRAPGPPRHADPTSG